MLLNHSFHFSLNAVTIFFSAQLNFNGRNIHAVAYLLSNSSLPGVYLNYHSSFMNRNSNQLVETWMSSEVIQDHAESLVGLFSWKTLEKINL